MMPPFTRQQAVFALHLLPFHGQDGGEVIDRYCHFFDRMIPFRGGVAAPGKPPTTGAEAWQRIRDQFGRPDPAILIDQICTQSAWLEWQHRDFVATIALEYVENLGSVMTIRLACGEATGAIMDRLLIAWGHRRPLSEVGGLRLPNHDGVGFDLNRLNDPLELPNWNVPGNSDVQSAATREESSQASAKSVAGKRDLMTVAEYAAHRRCAPGTVRGWCRDGMPHSRNGKGATSPYRIPVAEADDWLAARARNNVAPKSSSSHSTQSNRIPKRHEVRDSRGRLLAEGTIHED